MNGISPGPLTDDETTSPRTDSREPQRVPAQGPPGARDDDHNKEHGVPEEVDKRNGARLHDWPSTPVATLGHRRDSSKPALARSPPNFSLRHGRQRSNSENIPSPTLGLADRDRFVKLSPDKIQELTSEPTSLPLRTASPIAVDPAVGGSTVAKDSILNPTDGNAQKPRAANGEASRIAKAEQGREPDAPISVSTRHFQVEQPISRRAFSAEDNDHLPSAQSKPASKRPSASSRGPSALDIGKLAQANTDDGPSKGSLEPRLKAIASSPSPIASIPLPPTSIPTYLQLELASERPSQLYIYRPSGLDFPYESSRVKFERLLSFLILPPLLEQVLWFGALTCLDAWLFTFTILPLRFFKAIWIVGKWCAGNAAKEARDLLEYVYQGSGRLWQRGFWKSESKAELKGKVSSSMDVALAGPGNVTSAAPQESKSHRGDQTRKHSKTRYRHRRTKSTPSALQPTHKADILKGLLVVVSCVILMRFDASRMYHGIRGQAAIKLYVIYNVLEVCDRLLSALGQDVLECLFSRETLERDVDGRSKIVRPFLIFILALVYNVIHATSLFYQVITLNVAVNSYSNALLTLLMSNQFVEIKSTVFKKFEKENVFQLTCADIVERFQLWMMLTIIALRNIVEVGGLWIKVADQRVPKPDFDANATASYSAPRSGGFIIPVSFDIFPKWTGQVLGPFLLVLGSEMLVDWIKHAYISKFNNTKPELYGRFLDVLAKDYYSNAFVSQNLTKRLGLPVIPLSCLFIRAIVQTYHMFLATYMPMPVPSTATSLVDADASTSASPATTSALAQIDHIFRRALGRSTFGGGVSEGASPGRLTWLFDDVIAFVTMVVVFLIVYLILLIAKLGLGMLLLTFAQSRYRGMAEREARDYDTQGKRVGGWGTVELDDEKKRWVYGDDSEGYKRSKERENAANKKSLAPLDSVARYSMVAKRIW